jgi:hypothetical protein
MLITPAVCLVLLAALAFVVHRVDEHGRLLGRLEQHEAARLAEGERILGERDALAAELAELRRAAGESAYEHLIGRVVIVNLRDGSLVRGVLGHVYTDALVLKHPSLPGQLQHQLGPEMVLRLDEAPTLQLAADVAAGTEA